MNTADTENMTEEFSEKFVIKKGKGRALKDICNVVSELEKRASSFSEALHCILYGENNEVEGYKKDVLEFSGFVSDDEECQRDKVKERLEKCTREMLSLLFSVFDISVENAFYAMKKKEIIELLLDFMEAPYDATEEAESSDREIPSRKRKPMTTEDAFTSKRVESIDKEPSEKIQEMDTGTSLEIIHEEENKEEDNNAASNEPEEMRAFEKEENITSENPKDSSTKMDMNDSSRGDRSFDLNANSSSEKLTKSVWELGKSKKMPKLTERRVAQGGNEQPKEWIDPSCEEVQKAISIILEETDITTATFSDVLEELDQHFEMDISPRKDAIMVVIEEELYRLANDTQEHESREENQREKEEGTQDGNEDNSTQVPCEVPVQT